MSTEIRMTYLRRPTVYEALVLLGYAITWGGMYISGQVLTSFIVSGIVVAFFVQRGIRKSSLHPGFWILPVVFLYIGSYPFALYLGVREGEGHPFLAVVVFVTIIFLYLA
mgnify:CR=1 FL=1